MNNKVTFEYGNQKHRPWNTELYSDRDTSDFKPVMKARALGLSELSFKETYYYIKGNYDISELESKWMQDLMDFVANEYKKNKNASEEEGGS